MMNASSSPSSQPIDKHYVRQDVAAAVFAALRQMGKDPAVLTTADLAPLDQFHSGGFESTRALLELAALPKGGNALDVGGGLGGPARFLSKDLGCRITGLDLTEEFGRVGALLTEPGGLSDRVSCQVGSALDMPFLSEQFDLVWMQNVTMNIPDKKRLFAEIHRVLRPGKRLAMQEVLAGPVQPLLFPVPWASDPSQSFLMTGDELRTLLRDTGFRDVAWQDITELALAARRRAAATGAGPTSAPLSAQILFGPDLATEIMRNAERNTHEGRMANVLIVADRV
jgi:SAM-dependent methyltransferase